MMADKITAEQLREIEDAMMFGTKEYHKLLEEYTGIKAMPYTGYSYYDSVGNYIGDSVDSDVMDLLRAADIEVEREDNNG